MAILIDEKLTGPSDLGTSRPKRVQVLVSHPARQHSHQLAAALAESDMLAHYFVGVPMSDDALPAMVRPLLRRFVRPMPPCLTPKHVSYHYSHAVVRKLSSWLCPARYKEAWDLRGNSLFDNVVASRVPSTRPDVVVCYERAALRTFQIARGLGIRTVLDAASFHHSWQDRWLESRSQSRSHQRVKRHKDAELALADHVLTASELARNSYIEAGVPPTRVTAIPVGVDTELFHPNSAPKRADEGRVVRFVFVGSLSKVKGVDVLADACRKLAGNSRRLEVTLVGGDVLMGVGALPPCVQVVKRMSQRELAQELCRHDVLVLPSRFDSFGMVVAEAMAAGLPAIISENVGAKEMIESGQNGLIIAVNDSQALASAMEWFIDNPSRLPGMSMAARMASERYDWKHYRARAIRFFGSLASIC